MRVVIDGNDGVGKSTVAGLLRARGYEVLDRGVPTKRTDDPSTPAGEGEVYLILDAPVELCRERLAKAGKDLTEKYHTVADLTHYRARFLEVAGTLPRAAVIDAVGGPAEVEARCLAAIRRLGEG